MHIHAPFVTSLPVEQLCLPDGAVMLRTCRVCLFLRALPARLALASVKPPIPGPDASTVTVTPPWTWRLQSEAALRLGQLGWESFLSWVQSFKFCPSLVSSSSLGRPRSSPWLCAPTATGFSRLGKAFMSCVTLCWELRGTSLG